MIVIYGIKNCDTVQKARKWLDMHNINHRYHDFRTDGLSQTHIQQWLSSTHLSLLLNKRSRSWKQLSEQQRTLISGPSLNQVNSSSHKMAIDLILEIPTLIKRPVLELGDDATIVGFSAQNYHQIFEQQILKA